MKKIEILYFEGCPNHQPAVDLVRSVVDELGTNASIVDVEVFGSDDAKQLRFLGSPSIHIDGIDVEPEARARTDFGFACRTYNGEGLPPREMLIAALMDSSTPSGECCLNEVAQGTEPGQPSQRVGKGRAMGKNVLASGAVAALEGSTPGEQRRFQWKKVLGIFPSVGSTLLPIGICPICLPAYAGVLSSLGLGFLFNSVYLFSFTAIFLLFGLGTFFYRARERRGYRPFALGVVGAAGMLAGKFLLMSNTLVYISLSVFIAAALWNAWPRKEKNADACDLCVTQT